MNLDNLISDEPTRRRVFPVTTRRIFMAHAAVSPLPRAAVEGMRAYAEQGSQDHQESGFIGDRVRQAREAAAELIGASPREVALLGPTSLGLNLVADGLDWRPGDEVLYYADDYPANVYPWIKLRDRGVKAVALQPEQPGRIDWSLVEKGLSDNTRLVALATCHYLSGYRIDSDTIGRNLRRRGILFCLDGIQTLGAFPLSVENVDFMSADSHKWMLGPMGAGVLFVKESRFEQMRPSLLGAWNVNSPDFLAQEKITFVGGARRYEPGALNIPGILGMLGSLQLLLQVGVESIGRRILMLRELILRQARARGYRLMTEQIDLDSLTEDDEKSGIVSLAHPGQDMKESFHLLGKAGIRVSLRRSRAGEDLLRLSPHFYNLEEEIEEIFTILDQ